MDRSRSVVMPERGRPLTTTQGRVHRAVSSSPSGRGIPGYRISRDRSPAAVRISPESGVTRKFSFNQRTSEDEEIVPRVSQPYRTSFSAVTSPGRVPVGSRQNSQSSALNDPGPSPPTGAWVRGGPTRVTSPGRFHASVIVGTKPLAASSQQAKSQDVLSDSGLKAAGASQSRDYSRSASQEVLEERGPRMMSRDYTRAASEDALDDRACRGRPPQAPRSGTSQPPSSYLEQAGAPGTLNKSGGAAFFPRGDQRYASTPARLKGAPSMGSSRNPSQDYLLTPGSDYREHDRTWSTADSVFTDAGSAPNLENSSLNEESVKQFMSPCESPNGLDPQTGNGSAFRNATVGTKQLITREYVQVHSVTYLKALEKERRKELPPANEQTHRIIRDLFQGVFHRSSAANNNNKSAVDGSDEKESLNDPGSPLYRGKQSRSNTLPSEDLLAADKHVPPVKKSSSSNFLGMFRKWSPKSFRKASGSKRNVSGSREPQTPGSDNGTLHFEPVEVDIEGNGHVGGSRSPGSPSHTHGSPGKQKGAGSAGKKSPKSPKKRFTLGRKSKRGGSKSGETSSAKASTDSLDASAATSATAVSPGPDSREKLPANMSGSSARMLKSIEDHKHASSGQEKAIYQAFKERQSPMARAATEAHTMKSQALKAVEFPDNLLAQDQQRKLSSPSNPPEAAPPPYGEGCTPGREQQQQQHPPRAASQRDTSNGAPTAEGQRSEVRSRTRRLQEPPRTLNVRDVSKLNKKHFSVASMASVDSIGQCSLDTTEG